MFSHAISVVHSSLAWAGLVIAASTTSVGCQSSPSSSSSEGNASAILRSMGRSAPESEQGSPAAEGESTAQSAPPVTVNGVRLTDREWAMLSAIVHVPVPAGTYWYDRITGAWGREGGPTTAFVPAGLPIGGPLRADASHGNTGVFINGRQLHMLDVLNLQNYIGQPVIPGRYWMDARGDFGYEGGPVMGNLAMVAQQNHPGISRQGNTLTECYGNGACSSGNSNTGSGVITDGQGGAMVHTPDGRVVTTP